MEKQFRVQIRLRWLANLTAIVLTAYSLLDIYRYVVHSPFMMPMEDLFTVIVCNFFIVITSIHLNKLKYVISDEELIIRRILRRDKCYKVSKARKIKEISGLIPYVKVYFKGKVMPITCLADKHKEFIEILQEGSR